MSRLDRRLVLWYQEVMSRTFTVYYFPIDASGVEVGDPILIDLNPDGSANLSRLPPAIRSHLETFGVRNALLNRLTAKDGEAFLRSLLEATNGYIRFRSSPRKQAHSSLN